MQEKQPEKSPVLGYIALAGLVIWLGNCAATGFHDHFTKDGIKAREEQEYQENVASRDAAQKRYNERRDAEGAQRAKEIMREYEYQRSRGRE
jgi:hypothetical protein